jgi:repressor LexA
MAAGDGGVPVLGFIPAGPLSEVLAHCEEVLDLGTILPYQAGDFLLVVNGQSMIGDGILPGDKVLLRPDVQVQNGEIAAVHFGDQYLATLKHVCFQSDNKIITLRASNEKYPDVNVPGRELQIVGVFRGLVRTI